MQFGLDGGRAVYIVRREGRWITGAWLDPWLIRTWNRIACFFLRHEKCSEPDCNCGHDSCIWCERKLP